jgi:hypothetical protein
MRRPVLGRTTTGSSVPPWAWAYREARLPDDQVERLVRHGRDEKELAETALMMLRAADAGVDYRVTAWAYRTCGYAGACRV